MNLLKGYLCVVAAAIMWASSGTAGKGLFEQGITPFELVQIRVTLASVLMAMVFGIFTKELFRIRVKDLGYFLLLGGVGMTLVQGTYFYTISKIQVAAAILIQYLAPIFVAFYAICFWKERLTGAKLSAIVLALGGCYLVVGGYNLQLLAGYTLLVERGMHRYRPWTMLFYSMAFAALAWHMVYPPFHYLIAGFSWAQWGWILYITVVGTIMPFGLYFVGINYIRSTRASITATLEPISAGFFAFIFLGEALEPLQILGGILVICAIVLLQLQQEQDEMTPERIRTRRS